MSFALVHLISNEIDVSVTFNQAYGKPKRFYPKYARDNKLVFTRVDVTINSFPEDEKLVFPYHIHEKPVSEDCYSTGGHYDPAGVKKMAGDNYKCAEDHSQCEAGDLSGKHGALNNTGIIYFDYLPEANELANYSFVIHNNTDPKIRIACTNIDLITKAY